MNKPQSQHINRLKEIVAAAYQNELNHMNPNEFQTNPIISKQEIREMTGLQIQSELKKKYNSLQTGVNDIENTSHEIDKLFELLERLYLVQYSIKRSDEINVNNCYVIMNEIAAELAYYEYNNASELKIKTEQTKIQSVQEEVKSKVEKKETLNKHVTRVMNKSKWEIDNKLMKTIGRYFNSNEDYINVMKVNKKYKNLTRMYEFNPISDTTMFKHMKIQHFYRSSDKKNKLMNMKFYIYWYNDKEAKQQPQLNEIFKYEIRMENNKGKKMISSIDIDNECIQDNVGLLEEWSGLQVNTVLYDSQRDGKGSSTFRHKILNHQHLYFIAIDDKDNVFGHYHPSVIDRVDNSDDRNNNYITDDNIFMFTLFSNGRCGAKKSIKKCEHLYTSIFSKESFYVCSYNNDNSYNSCFYGILDFSRTSYVNESAMRKGFENLSMNDLTANGQDNFVLQRVVVIEMN